MNEGFIFKSIHKYNRAKRQTQKDCILHAVGVHTGLIERQQSPLPTLTKEECDRVLYFLRQFLASQNCRAVLKD